MDAQSLPQQLQLQLDAKQAHFQPQLFQAYGHRLGTAEVESALVLHPVVAEAAVVGFEHPIKGQGIYAFVTLMVGEEFSDELSAELRNFVGKEIGPIAKPVLQ